MKAARINDTSGKPGHSIYAGTNELTKTVSARHEMLHET
jgi:hypothetical protein